MNKKNTFNKYIAIILSIFIIISSIVGNIQYSIANTDSYQLIAKNKILELYANLKYGYLKIIDKRSNNIWYSSPENWKQNTIVAGSTRMQMASQLTVKYTDVTSAIQLSNSYVGSALRKGLKIQKISNGILATYTFRKEGFVIPVTYTIKDDYLNVEILVNKIKELKKERYKIVSVELLPYFGAGSSKDNGYIVVPDGCGAIINFNNNKGNETYSQRIYGNDYAIVPEYQGYVVQKIRLPVFGMKKNDSAFVAVITNGDSKTNLNAFTSSDKTNYNSVFPEFIFREYDTIKFKEKQWNEREFNFYEEKIPNIEKYSIRYYFLNSSNTNYVSMAEKYREYLIKEKNFKKVADYNSTPVYLEFYGSMKKTKYIMGLPINTSIPLTTFNDAKNIVNEVKKFGVDNIVVKYMGWIQNGVYYNLPLSEKPEGVLGGTKEYKEMLDYFNSKGIRTYFDVDFATFRKGTLQFTTNSVATKSIKKVKAELNRFSPATFYVKDTYPTLYLISPRYLNKIVDRFLGNRNIDYFDNISISSLSSMIYSDFGTYSVNRNQSEQIILKNVENIKKKFEKVMLTSPNAYLLSQASEIVDVPIFSSKFLIEDNEIPFYQIVLRGYIPYSMPSVNFYTNEWFWKLKALETGSYLKFTWTARNEDELKETLLDNLYSSNYKMWLIDLKDSYKEIYPILNIIKGKKIIDHIILKGGLVKVIYDGGIVIYLNYTSNLQIIENNNIPAHSYKVIKVKR